MFHLFKSQTTINTRFRVFHWCKIRVDFIQLLKSINRNIECIFAHFYLYFATNCILQEGIDLNVFLFTNRVKKNVLKTVCLTRNTLYLTLVLIQF